MISTLQKFPLILDAIGNKHSAGSFAKGVPGEPWGLHVIVATDCLDLAETMPHRWQEPRDDRWIGEPEVFDGSIDPGDEPGFGVRLNEELL